MHEYAVEIAPVLKLILWLVKLNGRGFIFTVTAMGCSDMLAL
jgi:hypothetical protein